MKIDGKEIKITDIMRPVMTIKKDATLRETLEKMIGKRTNSLVVVDADGVFLGTVSALLLIKEVVPDYLETDQLAAHFVSEELFKEDVSRAADVKVEAFMDSDSSTLKVSDSIMRAAIMAMESGSARVPVVDDDNKPLGILTRTELKQVIGLYLGIEGCFRE